MAKALFPIKWREKLARRVLQIQSVTELADELKPDCLLKTSVLWPFANELVTLIVSAVGSASTLGHGTVPKGKEYQPDIPTLISVCSEESNIQELKARPPLRELAPNINITSADPPPKQCGLPRKKNVQQLPYEVILDLNVRQDLLPNTRERPREADRQRLPAEGALLEVNEDFDAHEDAPSKKQGQTKKTDLSGGGRRGTIVDLKEQDLVNARDRVQKHDDEQQAKKRKAAMVPRDNRNRSRKKKCN